MGMPHTYALVHSGDREAEPVDAPGVVEGLQFAPLVGPDEGSVHMQLGHSVLLPGGSVAGHLHAYEETFFILSGSVSLRLGGFDYALAAGDFGVVPMAVPHSWANTTDEPVRWLRVRAPQPRDVDDETQGTYLCDGFGLPRQATAPAFGLPSVRHFGHFSDEQMPPPGPIAIRGANNYGVRNISVRLMIDDTVGAKHHIMFVGQMASDRDRVSDVPPPHYHAFEETYYFVGGTARGLLEDNEFDITAGDVAFAGVNALHGFVPTSDDPLRWIEVMAPRPPEQDSMMFVGQWERLRSAPADGGR